MKYPNSSDNPNPSTRIYWKDVRSNQALRMCSLAARGLWMCDMLPIMSGGGGYLAIDGVALTLEQLSALAGKPLPEVAAAYQELIDNRVFLLDRNKTPYHFGLISVSKKVESARENGKKGGRPKLVINNDISEKKTEIKSEPKANDNPPRGRARVLQDSKTPLLLHASEEDNTIIDARTALGFVESDWENFWTAYPHKVAKPLARKAFEKSIRKAKIQEILAGLARYIANNPPEWHWANPATWLNQERWNDPWDAKPKKAVEYPDTMY